MTDFKVGTITHYFDKIGVAVVELSDSLSVGETIRITGNGGDFTQKVESMQIEHEQIENAKKGDTVGMKVEQPVQPQNEVYKVA